MTAHIVIYCPIFYINLSHYLYLFSVDTLILSSPGNKYSTNISTHNSAIIKTQAQPSTDYGSNLNTLQGGEGRGHKAPILYYY